MPQFLSGLGTLLGGPGNEGAASSNAWNYGQYSPFTVNNPAGQISFNGTTANSQLSPLQQQIQGVLGGNITGANTQYNPNTGFLPQQYQQIFGNYQNDVNSQFNSLQQAQAPWLAQQRVSNLDNEFSKGTLASTAGGYQTAGMDMAQNSQMNTNMAQAQQYALQKASSQFGAAQGTAGLGEQQAQFAPQLGMGLLNSSLSGLNQQNQGFLQMLQAGGNLGAQRSGANVAAAVPGMQSGATQDQATAGLLSGLLFGGGTSGGLLQGLLGGGQGGQQGGLGAIGSLLGKGIGSIFGGGGGSSAQPNTGNNYGLNPDNNYTSNNPQTSYQPDDPYTSDNGSGTTTWWGDGGFNGASGQAANGLQNIGVDNASTLPSVQNAVNGAGSGVGLGSLASAGGYLSGLGGIASGIAKGGASGGVQAAGNAGALYNKFTGQSGGFGGLLGQAGSALNIYNGFTSGTPEGIASGAASTAGLAASSGAASALGASAGTVAALGAAATGIGAIAAMPAVVQGVGGLLMGKLFGMDKPDREGNELNILRTKGGVTEVPGTAGQNTFGLGTQLADYWNGKPLQLTPDSVQKASDLYLSGNMSAYQAYMNTLVKH